MKISDRTGDKEVPIGVRETLRNTFPWNGKYVDLRHYPTGSAKSSRANNSLIIVKKTSVENFMNRDLITEVTRMSFEPTVRFR